jgi:two-component system, NtrC family, sensor histidine kinase HydH
VSTFLDEVLAYVQLGEPEQALLRELRPKLAPSFPKIADQFYAAVWASPKAAAVLASPEQVARLRTTLIDWMATGLVGPYDDKFYEKRSRIGRRHVQIGLAQQFMFTAMSVVRAGYHDEVVAIFGDDHASAQATSRAIDKLLDVELALMLRHYQLDSEERLVERERRIQADRITAMQTLSAGLAHEVRNPLNAARLQLELLMRRLRRQLGDDPKFLEPTELAEHEISRLTELLNDFLSFARPPELHRHGHDIVAICRHVLELERPLAQRRKVELSLTEPGPLMAHVDSGKIHQVIQNLVRNALEAAPAGGHVSVTISNHVENAVHVKVKDDGSGIPKDVLQRIYEPFFSTKEGGTGMGMAIVHSLVTLHGGRIDIDTGDRGTTFEIVLPQRAAVPTD